MQFKTEHIKHLMEHLSRIKYFKFTFSYQIYLKGLIEIETYIQNYFSLRK